MTNSTDGTKDIAPRRSFFGHIGGAVVLGLAGLVPKSLHAQTPAASSDGPNWPGTLKGRHRQVVDGYEANSGFRLVFAYTFLCPNESATAVVIKIIDPETSAGDKESLPESQARRPSAARCVP